MMLGRDRAGLHAYRTRPKEASLATHCRKAGNDDAPVKHDQQQLAQILLDRRTKRRSLTALARHCGYEPARHHKLIVSRLEAVARGEIRRLMIIAPPGSAKSTYASILFPCWLMANKPDAAILCASHTVELADKWGRRICGLIADHGVTLGIGLSPESKAAGRWSLTTSGEFLAAGVGTGIAGFRAHGVIVDDPTRSFEDSASPTIRDRNWAWFKADLRTRLRPDGFIVVIGTRWHYDDIFGRAIDEMNKGGEQWQILHLEAQCEGNNDPLDREVGQFLWDDDEKYPDAELLQREKLIQPARNWSALFQGRPTPEKGDFFEDGWLVSYDEHPPVDEMSVYAPQISLSLLMEGTIPAILLWVSTLMVVCIYLTSGAAKQLLTNGLRSSAILSNAGDPERGDWRAGK